MIYLAPIKKATKLLVAIRESIEIPLGYYIEINPESLTLIVKNIVTNTVQCVHPLGKTVFSLSRKHFQLIMEKVEAGKDFRYIKK